MINIVEYIPYGQANAITRRRLCRLTGLPDREVRELIGVARNKTAIINLQNGGGYFRPLPEERRLVERWMAQEKRRAKRVFWSLKGARDFLRR